jgi:hypothetical protein
VNLVGVIAACGGRAVKASLQYLLGYETPANTAALAGTWSYVARSKNSFLTGGNFTMDTLGNVALTRENCVTNVSIAARNAARKEGQNIYTPSVVSRGSA